MSGGKYNFFAFISRMKYISRWGLMRNTQSENLKEHSYDVSVITHALLTIANTEFGKGFDVNYGATLALYHDCGEIFTGDLPTPVKYKSPEIKEAYAELEFSAKEKILAMLPSSMAKEYRTYFFEDDKNRAYIPYIKAADKISAFIKCLEEEKAGNCEFKTAREAVLQLISKLQLKEAEIFLERFSKSYGLTLDEL